MYIYIYTYICIYSIHTCNYMHAYIYTYTYYGSVYPDGFAKKKSDRPKKGCEFKELWFFTTYPDGISCFTKPKKMKKNIL